MKKLQALFIFCILWIFQQEAEPVDIDFATLRYKIRNADDLGELDKLDQAIDDFDCKYRGRYDTHIYFTTLQQEMSERTQYLTRVQMATMV
jgi:hypothetical protein